MKKILLSLAIILVVGGIVWGATTAFYNDTETSTGNIFTAGSVDLKVDHTYASYDGVECVGNCVETGNSLIVNGGFETPDVPTGSYAIYPNATLTSWEVTGGDGLEIQDHAAGAPHWGEQLAELDSNNQSSIKQVINTTPGQKYRLTFWHSPRPDNNANDNAINFKVKVTSTSGVMINDTVELTSAGGSTTSWTEYTYNFIALDTQTTVEFADAGIQNDSYGGYIDDVSVKALNCPQGTAFPYGGICTVWGEQDLGQNGHSFWSFPDIKPGDYGTNIISLHDYGNDAYACLLPKNIQDDENTLLAPESLAGDTTNPEGELSGGLQFFMWNDANSNNVFDSGESVLVNAGTPFNQIINQMSRLSLVGNAPITLIGINWCAGTQTLSGSTVNCNGNGMGNKMQTDKMMADFEAYAVQQRNNADFTCASVSLTHPENY